jgi:arsenate reductase (thioredoxin)
MHTQRRPVSDGLGFFEALTRDRAVAWSGGSEPGHEVNPAAIAAMAERGIDISNEFPKPWTDETVRAADVIITMGCGDACPIFPGKRYESWDESTRQLEMGATPSSRGSQN